jgi:subtilase family serine protease
LVLIPAGKTKIIVEYWKYNTYGNFLSKLNVDPGNKIPETNENNNYASVLVQIQNPTPSSSGSKKSIISQEFS